VEENASESELRNIRRQSKFKVKLWELVEMDRIKRKQKEVVQKKMTMSELIQHLQDLTVKARANYVRYKCVDWIFDLLKYNRFQNMGGSLSSLITLSILTSEVSTLHVGPLIHMLWWTFLLFTSIGRYN
jgi:hypothetical protein